MRGRARLPGGRDGRDAGAFAEPLRLALPQPPAASAKPVTAPRRSHGAGPAAPRRKPNSCSRSPGTPRPLEKGSASRSRPSSHPLIQGRPLEERSLRRGSSSLPASRASRRRGGVEGETFKSRGGQRSSHEPAQTPKRPPERSGCQPVEALSGAAAE